MTWNNQFPNPLSKDQLLSDLTTAYGAGATYEIIYTFPNATDYSYGTLPPQDFDAIQTFWNDLHTNPRQFGARHG